MRKVRPERLTVEVEGSFVVFLIGMRVNKPWKVRAWWPTFMAMPRMLKELEKDPSSGFLGAENSLGLIVQYWRSFEDLERYANSREQEHWPAWRAFNQRVRDSRGDVGIWHETYKVEAGAYEAVYSGMPTRGLGRVGRLVPATGRRETARQRLLRELPEQGHRDGDRIPG
jgi:fumigallin biosynthesis monooxygenase-like protein